MAEAQVHAFYAGKGQGVAKQKAPRQWSASERVAGLEQSPRKGEEIGGLALGLFWAAVVTGRGRHTVNPAIFATVAMSVPLVRPLCLDKSNVGAS